MYRDLVATLVNENRLDDAFHILEHLRAREFLRLLAEQSLFFRNISSEARKSLKGISYQYDRIQHKMWSMPAKDKSREIFHQELQTLRVQSRDIVEDIIRSSPGYKQLRYPRPLSASTTRELLSPGTIMLSYGFNKGIAYLFILKNDSPLKIHTIIIDELSLHEEIVDFLSMLKSPFHGPVSADILKNHSTKLFDLLVAPAQDDIEESDRVLIIPDGSLWSLPFGLLGKSEGNATPRYFIEWKPVASVASSTVYELLKNRKNERPIRIVAFGDPIYPMENLSSKINKTDSSEHFNRLFNPLKLKRLPSTSDEIYSIANVFPDNTTMYFREEATEERVKSLGTKASIIHFACHGGFDNETPLNSGIALSFQSKLKKGKENGILQAREIFEEMHLDADLVVLSSCQTGLGKEVGGEGLIGLTRAFQYAGARSIIASLWSVNDASTAVLMEKFYRYLKDGYTKDQALRHAQMDLIRKPIRFQNEKGEWIEMDASHPYYWGAFQLIGPWD